MPRPKATHCPQGHEYTPENTYQRANGKRECRICRREKKNANDAPKREQEREIAKASASLVEGTKVKATDEEVETALVVLAKHSGNCRRASRELGKNASTLSDWRRIFHDRYLEIQADLAPQIRAKVAEQQIALAERVTEAETRALELTSAAIEKMDARDIPGALRNLSTTKGIALTQANNYSSAVTQPRESEDIEAILNGLRRLGVAKAVEAEAEEIQDAEVVPDP